MIDKYFQLIEMLEAKEELEEELNSIKRKISLNDEIIKGICREEKWQVKGNKEIVCKFDNSHHIRKGEIIDKLTAKI